MNKLKLLKELTNSLENFKIHPDLINDIIAISSQSGSEIQLLKKLNSALNFLKKFGNKAHLQPTNQFEKLKKENNMYSMHLQGNNFNIRILYSFLSDGTVLLHGFYEREGKAVTNYSSATKIARNRLNEMEDLL